MILSLHVYPDMTNLFFFIGVPNLHKLCLGATIAAIIILVLAVTVIG